MVIGCVMCGVYFMNVLEQVVYVVGYFDFKFLFVENEEQVDKVLQIYLDLKQFKKVVVWDLKGFWGFSYEGIIFYDVFFKQGDEYLQ